MQFLLSILLLFLANTTAGYLLPSPAGKYNVTLTTGPLFDFARNDPYAASPTPRALMVSIFQPATCTSALPVPYMPNRTAEYQEPFLKDTFNISADFSSLFLEARLPVCSDHSKDCSPLKSAPILLLSPGWGIPRFYYNVLASAIASEGFIVITIDHPEDANIIVYPDGHEVYLNATTWNNGNTTQSELTRAADASFVIDQLGNATAMAELLCQRQPHPLSTKRIGMLGHSLGGAAAVIAAGKDARIRGAINWDGTISGSLPRSGLSQGVLFIMNAVTPTPPDWVAAWPLLMGPKLWLEVANTTHQTFSDVPTLLHAAGQDTPALAPLLGTIAPDRLVRILVATTTVWMKAAFSGQKEGLELAEFPELSTVMQGNY